MRAFLGGAWRGALVGALCWLVGASLVTMPVRDSITVGVSVGATWLAFKGLDRLCGWLNRRDPL